MAINLKIKLKSEWHNCLKKLIEKDYAEGQMIKMRNEYHSEFAIILFLLSI